MAINLGNIQMSDRFTFPIDVYPQPRGFKATTKKFELILDYGNGSGRISKHATRECAERSVREFIEVASISKYNDGSIGIDKGGWEIREIEGDRS